MMETTKAARANWEKLAEFGDFAGRARHRAGSAILALIRDVNRLEEALRLRQGYMCCYPPEPCERCLADAELLKEEHQ